MIRACLRWALDDLDGLAQDGRERTEAALRLALLGQREQLALGRLDLLAAVLLSLGIEGPVDDVLADPDQAAAQGEVVDQAAILGGVDDGLGGLGEACQIARAVELA